MKTAIEALDRMSRMLFNYHGGAPVKVEDLQVELKTALTSLKSLEGPRLTVDEAMRVADIEEVRKALGFIKDIGTRKHDNAMDRIRSMENIVKWANHGLASLPQQDVGAGRYEVGDMVVFTDSAWVFRPNEDIGAHPNARNPRRVLAPPDRHGHFRIDGIDVDYATGIWVGSDEITLHSRAAGRSVPSEYVMSNVRPVVAWFAQQMEAALRRNDHKGGWAGHDGLLTRLREETDELHDAIVRHEANVIAPNTHPEQVTREAADVANFAMMLADNDGPRIGHALAVPSPVGQEPVAWNKPGDFPPPTIPPCHIMIGYSNRKAKDEDYSLRQLACYPPKGPWTDWYGVVPNPDRWAIIPIPDKDEARWHMPKRDIHGETYTTILVNAIQLPDHEKTRLVKDLCERGAHPPKAGVLTDEEMEHRALRWSCDHDQSIFTYSQSLAAFGKYLRDNGYLSPKP